MLFICPICSKAFEKAYEIYHHKDAHDKSLNFTNPLVKKQKTLKQKNIKKNSK